MVFAVSSLAAIARPNVGATIDGPHSVIQLLMFQSRHIQQAVLQAVCDVFRDPSHSVVECWFHNEGA